MVIKPKKKDISVEDALECRRLRGGPGRVLAKSFKKLADGKVNSPAIKIGVMAAALQLGDAGIRKALINYWVALMQPQVAIQCC